MNKYYPDATCGDCENAAGCIINGDKYPWSKVCGEFSPNREYRERTSLEAMVERIESLEKRFNKLEGAK